MSNTITECRSCGQTDLREVLNFGSSPLADVLLSEQDLDKQELRFPLELVFCPDCALVQITENVPPDILYGSDYPYYTSVNQTLVDHFAASARAIMERHPLTADSLVMEAASNDGYMLKIFAERGIPVLGIDPASGPVEAANQAGILSLCRFFDMGVADELVAQGKRADVLLGNNVLNLVQDLGDFMQATDKLLKPDGLVVLEVPYLVDSIDKVAFDNVFHQNTGYYSVTSVERLFRRYGLFLNDVEPISTFGGSLRLFFTRTDEAGESVRSYLARERERGVDRFEFYADFARAVESIKSELLELLAGLRRENKRVVAYGAAGGMATTLLNYMDLDRSSIEYAVDISHHKHGRYTAGSRLLIHAPEKLLEDMPDCILLLAWNFKEQVMQAQAEYIARGGKFLVPIPKPELI
jgi:hypothetical protein